MTLDWSGSVTGQEDKEKTEGKKKSLITVRKPLTILRYKEEG